MALTSNNIEMIKAIAHNDMHAARKAALASMTEDNSKKNEHICRIYRKLITSNASVLSSNLPNNIQSFLVSEIPAGFDSNRYFVRDSEQVIIDDIIKMKKISEKMTELHINYKNSTLLYGVSGTGKTELARYIAYKLNLPFFYVSFNTTINAMMGETAKNLHKIFSFCSTIPCVLMLDEIDCIALKRSSGGTKGADGELERTTIALMQELDQLPNYVTIIAATNRLDIVDEALLRRFSIKHEVKNMTLVELTQLANQFLEATNTTNYIDKNQLDILLSKCKNPGQLMPELIRMIGVALYEECKNDIIEEDTVDNNLLNLWEVTYTWKANIEAETEEDAISIGRHNRINTYANKGVSEQYSAKRAEFIGPNNNITN